jgi:uncharacterized protein (DUF342 family)
MLPVVLDIEQAKPGMTLEEDVLLPSGAILVNASQVLTISLIETILKRGIQKIQVVQEETTPQSSGEPINNAEEKETAIAPPAKAEQPAALPARPKIKVIPSKDGMAAKLCVEPSGADEEPLTAEDITEALSEAGVCFGIDDKAISGIVEKWKAFKRYYEIDAIAKGTAPQPAKEGPFDFSVKYISDTGKLAEARKARYFWELKDSGIEIQRVDPDTVIAKRQKDLPAIPGRTVRGDELPSTETVKFSLSLDPSVRLTADNKSIMPTTTGIVYFINSAVGVCPLNFDDSVELSLSPDKMKALLTLHPPGERGNHPSLAQVQTLLREASVVHGVLDEDIKTALSQCAQGHYPDQPVLIAEGTPPLKGENGKIEFLFNLETSLKPKVNPNGTADYKNVELVVSVSKDQELARLIAPTKGTPGRNILGQPAPASDGAAAKLPMGTNTAPSAANPGVLVAATDGNVKYNGTSVEINEGFFVKGNVDFSTGNIKYAKSVVVGGDIGSGFTVDCGGDLQVAGTIEDATVVVGGNVLCKLGFVGSGRGAIDAKGDVNLAFMKNQLVKCRQNVVIAKEALNCTILARKTVTAHGNPLSIAGGRIMARDRVCAYSIGNAGGIKSIIEVGTDFALIEDLEKTNAHLAEIIDNKTKLLQTYRKYERLVDLKRTLGEREEAMYAKLKATLNKYDQQLKALEERKKLIISNMFEFKNASITIEHAALPGTVFKIGSRMLQLKEEVVGPKTVRLVDDEIKIY